MLVHQDASRNSRIAFPEAQSDCPMDRRSVSSHGPRVATVDHGNHGALVLRLAAYPACVFYAPRLTIGRHSSRQGLAMCAHPAMRPPFFSASPAGKLASPCRDNVGNAAWRLRRANASSLPAHISESERAMNGRLFISNRCMTFAIARETMAAGPVGLDR